MTSKTVTAAENMNVNDEIAAFCASAHHNQPVEHPTTTTTTTTTTTQPQDLLTLDTVVPEPSISDSSLKNPASSVKKDKKRCKKMN